MLAQFLNPWQVSLKHSNLATEYNNYLISSVATRQDFFAAKLQSDFLALTIYLWVSTGLSSTCPSQCPEMLELLLVPLTSPWPLGYSAFQSQPIKSSDIPHIDRSLVLQWSRSHPDNGKTHATPSCFSIHPTVSAKALKHQPKGRAVSTQRAPSHNIPNSNLSSGHPVGTLEV